MRSSATHKVCFPVAGRPAILRAMDAYRAAGLQRFIVVVGALAGQVVETAGREFPDVSFIHQPVWLGTGHATRLGAASLREHKANVVALLTVSKQRIADQRRQLGLPWPETLENMPSCKGAGQRRPASST